MIHSIAQLCKNSSPKAFDFAFLSSNHLIRLMWSLGRCESGILVSCHVAKSKTVPHGETSHTLWSRCASVWNIFLRIFELLCHASLFFCFKTFESMGYLYSFLSFFWLMLLWHVIFSLCCFFSLMLFGMEIYICIFHSPYSLFGKDEEFGERDS
jgi:hypothetical protein